MHKNYDHEQISRNFATLFQAFICKHILELHHSHTGEIPDIPEPRHFDSGIELKFIMCVYLQPLLRSECEHSHISM